GLETVGVIGQAGGEEELVMVHRPLSPVAEGFRKLRTNLEFLAVDEALRTLMVTSPGPAEGKSMVSTNLAAAAAQAGRRVVLIEADLRNPRASEVIARSSKVGLTHALVEGSVNGKLQGTEVEGLLFLGAGEKPPNPAELLGSARMGEVLDRLLESVDLIVIDSAPMLPVADSVALSRRVDGVLLVVDVGRTRASAAQQAAEGLRQAGAKVVGAVLNNVPTGGGGYYNYRYYYGDEYNAYYGEDGKGGKRGRAKGLVSRVRDVLRNRR
ncbi:MAG: CpsD/CapB family tyrosine-protein kinase, partial [Chloroflexota bacterium]|nr:CpsD/CapB family tyrosine-protein kinase [Chloroflexota bacterium]